jgi:hypothetical protein
VIESQLFPVPLALVFVNIPLRRAEHVLCGDFSRKLTLALLFHRVAAIDQLA